MRNLWIPLSHFSNFLPNVAHIIEHCIVLRKAQNSTISCELDMLRCSVIFSEYRINQIVLADNMAPQPLYLFYNAERFHFREQ